MNSKNNIEENEITLIEFYIFYAVREENQNAPLTISKIIGKGMRAAYNKLIELENKNFVKGNRKRIGASKYWL